MTRLPRIELSVRKADAMDDPRAQRVTVELSMIYNEQCSCHLVWDQSIFFRDILVLVHAVSHGMSVWRSYGRKWRSCVPIGCENSVNDNNPSVFVWKAWHWWRGQIQLLISSPNYSFITVSWRMVRHDRKCVLQSDESIISKNETMYFLHVGWLKKGWRLIRSLLVFCNDGAVSSRYGILSGSSQLFCRC